MLYPPVFVDFLFYKYYTCYDVYNFVYVDVHLTGCTQYVICFNTMVHLCCGRTLAHIKSIQERYFIYLAFCALIPFMHVIITAVYCRSLFLIPGKYPQERYYTFKVNLVAYVTTTPHVPFLEKRTQGRRNKTLQNEHITMYYYLVISSMLF